MFKHSEQRGSETGEKFLFSITAWPLVCRHTGGEPKLASCTKIMAPTRKWKRESESSQAHGDRCGCDVSAPGGHLWKYIMDTFQPGQKKTKVLPDTGSECHADVEKELNSRPRVKLSRPQAGEHGDPMEIEMRRSKSHKLRMRFCIKCRNGSCVRVHLNIEFWASTPGEFVLDGFLESTRDATGSEDMWDVKCVYSRSKWPRWRTERKRRDDVVSFKTEGQGDRRSFIVFGKTLRKSCVVDLVDSCSSLITSPWMTGVITNPEGAAERARRRLKGPGSEGDKGRRGPGGGRGADSRRKDEGGQNVKLTMENKTKRLRVLKPRRIHTAD
ncbi:unnamed protein product [Pleuronectes platessa]|uniref:Uncharacterized protein n=1 Tax=Pleuronectes platessa TaxID=8262 RepID=A0A9N7YEJ3_PLEPL|nr:unnamed protein product [Pleuronectes platessa]